MSVYGYRYGRVPEMLLYSDASDRACRLHAVLTRWADTKAGQQPTRDELASILRCSVDSLDRAVKELRDGGFLEVRPQFSEDGKARVANDYVLLENRTGAATPGRTDAATLTSANAESAGEGGRTVAAGGGRTDAAAIEVRDRTQIEAQNRRKLERPAAIERVFFAWKQDLGRNGTTKLTAERRTKINARLEEGYTVEQLVMVVTVGWRADPWPGRAEQNELCILLRSGSQVEKFLALADNPPQLQSGSPARFALNGDRVSSPTDLLAWARRGNTADGVKALEAWP